MYGRNIGEQLRQLLQRHGLDQQPVHACLLTALAFITHGVGGATDHRTTPQLLPGFDKPNVFGQGITAHAWHIAVSDNPIEVPLTPERQSRLSAVGGHHFMPEKLKLLSQDQAIGRQVIDDQQL